MDEMSDGGDPYSSEFPPPPPRLWHPRRAAPHPAWGRAVIAEPISQESLFPAPLLRTWALPTPATHKTTDGADSAEAIQGHEHEGPKIAVTSGDGERASNPREDCHAQCARRMRRRYVHTTSWRKRYRANLNDKFDELRDCLVNARAYLSEDYRPDSQSGSAEEQLWMSRVQVLMEAVGYIRHLEEANDRATEYIEKAEAKRV